MAEHVRVDSIDSGLVTTFLNGLIESAGAHRPSISDPEVPLSRVSVFRPSEEVQIQRFTTLLSQPDSPLAAILPHHPADAVLNIDERVEISFWGELQGRHFANA